MTRACFCDYYTLTSVKLSCALLYLALSACMEKVYDLLSNPAFISLHAEVKKLQGRMCS